MAAVNTYSVLPAATVRLELRTALGKNDYKRVLALLERQKNVAEAIGATNFMKHDLIENTDMALKHASLVNKQAVFADWLAELKKFAPREYRLFPMLAKSLAMTSPEAARELAGNAINLLPIDEASYRALIDASLAKDTGRLSEICDRYNSAQLGSFYSWYFQNKGSLNQDVRTLVFSVAAAGEKEVFGVSHELELGKPRTSEFNFDQKVAAERFNLILPTIPGVRLTIYQVQLESASQTVVYKPEQLFITPTLGYVASVNQVIHISDAGENIAIQPKVGVFPPFSRLVLSYRIDKLALSNEPTCLQ